MANSRKKLERYGVDALIEVFGTPHPSNAAISKWRSSWAETGGREFIKSYMDGLKLLKELGIEPLYYQMDFAGSILLRSPKPKSTRMVTFYRDQDRLLFKLRNG
jgi:hypothetical protein